MDSIAKLKQEERRFKIETWVYLVLNKLI